MRLPSNYHYFDYAAGWPVREEALTTYITAARAAGNPGSVHRAGQRALAWLGESRRMIAEAVGVHEKDVVFTATATEANNLAIAGTVAAFKKQYPNVLPRIAISAIEHDAVRVPAERLAAQGEVELVTIPVDIEKGIDLKAIEAVLDSRTALISVMQVNNETGIMLPIDKVSRLIRSYREDGSWPRLHSDAAQALAYIEDRATQYADLTTYSGYKVGGVTGSAVLIASDLKLLEPVIVGGGQERGLRSGTEDVAAAASFARAVQLVRTEIKNEQARIASLKKVFLKELALHNPHAVENSAELVSAPHIINIWLPDTHAQQTVTKLDLAGFAIAAGPACSARSIEPSKTLLALGYDAKRAMESIRISFGPDSNEENVRALIAALA